MAQKIIRSWETLWKLARRAGCTHWNYSRGKLRFRTMTRQPYAIGHEIPISAGPPVRVRFYTLTDGELVANSDRTILFRPPTTSATIPPDFAKRPPKDQAAYIAGLIDMLSAPRFIKQLSPANRMLLRIVTAQHKQIATLEQRIAELQRSQPEPAKATPAAIQTGRALASPGLSKDKVQGDPGLMTVLAGVHLLMQMKRRRG